MTVDWIKVKQVLYPIKEYEDVVHNLRASFAYPLVRAKFNFPLLELITYTQALLGGDPKQRYDGYAAKLTEILTALHESGTRDLLSLLDRVDTRAGLEAYTADCGAAGHEVALVLQYLDYWVLPREKYLTALVRDDPQSLQAVKALQICGVRTNLQLLQLGACTADREALANSSGLQMETVRAVVDRADLSRLPWASKATVSNIINAGYGSLDRLAGADPEQLNADFYAYGRSIGKNLKFGNEIENSRRIARLVPRLVE